MEFVKAIIAESKFKAQEKVGDYWYVRFNESHDEETGTVSCVECVTYTRPTKAVINSIKAEYASVALKEELSLLEYQITVKKTYLSDTDYMVIRSVERGESLSDDVRNERESARSFINNAEERIAEITNELNKE